MEYTYLDDGCGGIWHYSSSRCVLEVVFKRCQTWGVFFPSTIGHGEQYFNHADYHLISSKVHMEFTFTKDQYILEGWLHLFGQKLPYTMKSLKESFGKSNYSLNDPRNST